MDLVAFINSYTSAVWLIIGLILLAGEILLPGVYLMWLGGAAVLTSSAVYLMGDLGHVGNGVVFVVIAVLSIIFANRTAYAQAQKEGGGVVNTRGGQHIGQSYEVVQAIHNGRGRIKVADSNWIAEGPDCPEGTMVKVKEVDGSLMRVDIAN